jgi:predicted DNA-binding transcriptional regulator AlpA
MTCAWVEELAEEIADRVAAKLSQADRGSLAPGLRDRILTSGCLTEREAAKRLRVSVQLLRKWRAKKGGPRYLKLGGKCIRYTAEDIEGYIQSQRQEGAEMPGGTVTPIQ